MHPSPIDPPSPKSGFDVSRLLKLRVFVATFFVWATLSGLAATKLISLGHPTKIVMKSWLSPLAGPFAFAEHAMFLQSPIGFALGAAAIACFMIAHLVRPSPTTAGLTVLGISLWCLIGFSITYIGV